MDLEAFAEAQNSMYQLGVEHTEKKYLTLLKECRDALKDETILISGLLQKIDELINKP